MKIVNDFPPNIAAIRKRFEMTGFPTAIFAYGDTLYNPSGMEIPPDLIAHEELHSKQQEIYGLQDWWTRYLEDDAFRLGQEVEAYRKQYEYAKEKYNRDQRRWVLNEIVKNLSSKLYGNVINKKRAKDLINV
jgi:hypothetical protein